MLCFGVRCGVMCGACPSKTSPCIPAPRAHVETHVRVVPVHTGRFERTHGHVLNGHTAGRGRFIVSSAYQNLPT